MNYSTGFYHYSHLHFLKFNLKYVKCVTSGLITKHIRIIVAFGDNTPLVPILSQMN